MDSGNKAIGRKFIDIGPDYYFRFKNWRAASIFYDMERQLLKKYWNYWIDLPLWLINKLR